MFVTWGSSLSLINIESLQKPIPPGRFALFALGFRPFFLMAGLAAVILLGLWLLTVSGRIGLDTYYGQIGWHSHEMVFGFAVAVIAGFLLTAVRNWTNVQTLHGPWLAVLVGVWVLGRITPLLPGLPRLLVAISDFMFLPLLMMAIAVPIIRSKKQPQLILVGVLMLLCFANALIHLRWWGTTDTASLGITLALNSVALLIMIMAGRVFPFFTERAIPGAKSKTWPWVERMAFASFMLVVVMELFVPQSLLLAPVAGVAAVLHAVRCWGWFSRRVWSVPLLWVLYLGYGWLIIGLVFKALVASGGLPQTLALHAMASAISILCLGMMARVALGHTGRLLQPAKVVVWAFVMLNFAMLLRVMGPLVVAADWLMMVVLAAGGLWLLAYLIFVIVYLPILVKVRADGQPG